MEIQEFIPAPAEMTDMLQELAAGQTTVEFDEDCESFFLAVTGQEGDVLAACQGTFNFNTMRLSEIWVSEDWRGWGLGTGLLKRAEAIARTRQCSRIHLASCHQTARDLYAKVGFRVFGDVSGGNAVYYLKKPLG